MIDLNMTDFNGNYVIRKYNNAMGQYTGDYYYYQDIRGEGGHSEQEYLYVSVITGIVIHGVTRGNVTHTHAVTMTSITTGLSSEETVNGIKSVIFKSIIRIYTLLKPFLERKITSCVFISKVTQLCSLDSHSTFHLPSKIYSLAMVNGTIMK